MTIYTQIPGALDLSGVIGDDWSMGLDFDIALTGKTWDAAVTDSAGTSVAAITVTVVNASNCKLTLSISDTLTDALSEKEYRWYLKQTNSGSERVWLAGYFRWYKRQSARFGSSNGTTAAITVSSGSVSVAVASARGAAGLLWDTVSYTVGDLSGGGEVPYTRTVDIVIKLDDTEIGSDTVLYMTLLNTNNAPLNFSSGFGIVNAYNPSAYGISYAYYATGASGLSLKPYSNTETDIYLAIFKPNGGIEKILIDLTP